LNLDKIFHEIDEEELEKEKEVTGREKNRLIFSDSKMLHFRLEMNEGLFRGNLLNH